MKKILTKILFISLLFSAAVPSNVQASFNWAAWKNRAVEIGSKTVNCLTTNGKSAFIFFQKHPVALVAGAAFAVFLKKRPVALAAGATFLVSWNLKKVIENKVKQNKKAVDNNLTIAIKNGDTDKVKQALKSGANANNKDERGNFPLILAAREGHFEIAELLLQHKANVNEKDHYGNTALIKAAENNHPKVIELLLANKDVVVDSENKFGSTAIKEARHRHNSEAVELLENF